MDPLTLERHSMPVIEGCFLLLCRLESINALRGGGGRWMGGRGVGGVIKNPDKITAATTRAKYCASMLVAQQPICQHAKLLLKRSFI